MAIEGPDQEVQFEADRITLDVPKEGITVEEGWAIKPLTHPTVSICDGICWQSIDLHCGDVNYTLTLQITKRQVDNFDFGAYIPHCELQVKWMKADEPAVDFSLTVNLLGANKPFNFVTIASPWSLPRLQLQGTHLVN